MNLRNHFHSKHTQYFRNLCIVLAFLYPVCFVVVLVPNHALPFTTTAFHALFVMVCTLVSAYFFQDVQVDKEGLIIDFLWKKLHVPWDKVIQIKPLLGIRGGKQTINVVIVDGLTLFHRLYGFLYGFSLKPAFILWPTVSDYQVLENDIEKHIKQNRKTNS